LTDTLAKIQMTMSVQRFEPAQLDERLCRQIVGAVEELDLAQLAITAQLTPA